MSRPLATLTLAEAYVRLWQGALAAAQRAVQSQESEALHNFRVAVRRLRVVVSHYGEPGTRQQKVMRRLKRIIAQTNAGRDHEVMLDWLAQQWPELSVAEQNGAHYWRRELVRSQGELPTMARLQRALRPVARQLALLGARETLVETFGAVAAQQLQHEGERLLQLMEDNSSVAQLHHLRLQAKRVRYLLNPFRDEQEVCGVAEQQLQHLQELLGAWHDSVICRQSLHRLVTARVAALEHAATRAVRRGVCPDVEVLTPELAGLMVLQRLSLKRQQTLHAAIVRDYLTNGAATLGAALYRAVAALREPAAKE